MRSATLITLAVIQATVALGQSHPARKTGHEFNVLVFSRTEGFRHQSIENGVAAIEQLGSGHGFNTTHTEDASMFDDAVLSGFDVVVFLNTTGDVLDTPQQEAFQRFIRSGGGFVGVHSAADTEYDWEWYGQLVGAYFESHPNSPNVREGSVYVVDRKHPSTTDLPSTWLRTDEWYSYRSNPRGDVHVLMTLDERTYGGGTMGADHPIAWCHDFEAGRAWYTGGGHTSASFDEPEFRDHLLGGIRYAAGEGGECSGTVWAHFERTILDDATWNPMDLAVADDGRVFYIERAGPIRMYDPVEQRSILIGQLDVYLQNEDGLLGIELDPDFEVNGWVYLFYSPPSPSVNRLSRFEISGGKLGISSESVLLEVPTQRQQCCHSAGSMAFDTSGNLYLSTGDNTNPFDSDGFAPIDERPGRAPWDAQKSSGNAVDLRGAILRVHPEPDGGYTIPAGNLFPPDGSEGAPEIYAMGLRNPFRISVDPVSGVLYWGDVGPDASAPSPNRGPRGYDEWNRTPAAGNFGWPFCIGNNEAYIDYDFATGASGAAFDCDQPVNDSPNNTGPDTLPPAQPAWIWYPYGDSPDFPGVRGGSGRTAMAGPVFNVSQIDETETALPDYYDGSVFIYEWSRNWISEVKLADDGSPLAIMPFLPAEIFRRPMSMELGPDGSLYLLEWGSGFGGNNVDSRLSRISHSPGNRAPVVRAAAEPTSGPLPLTVSFSGTGSYDPDPGDFITFEWDFESDGVPDAAGEEVEHTYTEPGNFEARLTATDGTGNEVVRSWSIIAGNSVPEVFIQHPPDGGFYGPGDVIDFEIDVVDAEDGSTADGTIDCGTVVFQVFIGHDEHSHPLERFESCSGAFTPIEHGDDGEDLFYVVEAEYTDQGADDVGSVTSSRLHLLQPKRRQAQYFSETGGVELETTTDPLGGAQNLAYIDDGDWVSYSPVSLENIDFISFRVASAGPGGRIWLRADAVDGPVIGTTDVHPTGGWQTWTDVSAAIDAPDDVSVLYLVFTGSGDGLFNINYFRTHGRGVAREDTLSGPAGLLAEYFNNTDLSGEPVNSRIEPGVSFNWGRRSPADGVRIDHFSVRWSGSVTPPDGGTYRFFVDTDNSVRVWLDGGLIIDRWDSPANGEVGSRSVRLDGDRSYDLVVEYFHQTAGARVILRWDGSSIAKQVIEEDLLSPERTINTSTETFNLPTEFALKGAYPNPFFRDLHIAFDVPHVDRVRIDLFDTAGRLVSNLLDRDVAAGRHTVSFSVPNLSSGLYGLRVSSSDWTAIRRVIHIK